MKELQSNSTSKQICNQVEALTLENQSIKQKLIETQAVNSELEIMVFFSYTLKNNNLYNKYNLYFINNLFFYCD
jgi:hypothetical protein